MRLLDRHIIAEQLKVFTLALLVLVSVLSLEKVNFLSELLLSKNAPVSAIGDMLLYLSPTFFTLATPLAVLMSSLMVFSRLSADNEINAMRAGGISNFRLVAPVGFVGIGALLMTLYLSIYVTHESNIAFRSTVIGILKSNLNIELKERRFNTRFPGYVIYINKKEGDILRGVFISDMKDQNHPRVIEAMEGLIEPEPELDSLLLRLYNGVIHSEGVSGDYQTISFMTYTLRINLDSGSATSFEKEIPHMSILELEQRIEKIKARIINGEALKPPYSEQVAIQQKFSAPFGCLVLALLGAPLGIMTHRRGASGGFGLGVVMIILNYILWMVGQGLGSEGKIPPIVGVWGPNFIMVSLFAYLMMKVSRP